MTSLTKIAKRGPDRYLSTELPSFSRSYDPVTREMTGITMHFINADGEPAYRVDIDRDTAIRLGRLIAEGLARPLPLPPFGHSL